MKKVGFIVLILFLIFISCKSKDAVIVKATEKDVNYIPYYLKVYEADSLYLTNNFEKSYQILDDLFREYEPLNVDGWYEYSNYIASSVMSGHIKDIKGKVLKGFKEFGGIGSYHNNSFMFKDSILKVSKISNKEIDSLKNIYFKGLNVELRTQIEMMIKEDQSARLDNYNENKIKFYSEKHKKKIYEILQVIGYPSIKILGSENYFDYTADIKLLLMHQSDSSKTDLLPKLLFYLKKGDCDPSTYSMIYDKKMWEKEQKQLYGTFPINKYYPSLVYPKKVDSLRKSIGLPNLSYIEWRNSKMN